MLPRVLRPLPGTGPFRAPRYSSPWPAGRDGRLGALPDRLAGAMAMPGVSVCLTDYPNFRAAYKRYATSSLVALAHSYLDNDGQSYRQTVCPGEAPPDYHYQSLASGDPSSCVSASIDDRLLRHSTVWRTLTWLGRQGSRSAGPPTDPRAPSPVALPSLCGRLAPQKFRSPQRQALLEQARQLLQVIDEWETLFPEPFFPRFATRAGFD